MPISSRLVAADSIWNCEASPAFFTKSFITNSAMGLRQIFPWHTKSIFFIAFALLRYFFFFSIAGKYLFVERRMRPRLRSYGFQQFCFLPAEAQRGSDVPRPFLAAAAPL